MYLNEIAVSTITGLKRTDEKRDHSTIASLSAYPEIRSERLRTKPEISG
jgi:hypothetical protein